MDTKLKRDIMLEHYQQPVNRGLINDNSYVKVNTRNSSCVDNIDVMMKLNGNVLEDIRFDGEACAICTSATSIMIKTLLGKTKEDVKKIVDNYEKMINEEPYDESVLQELIVYDEIYKQPSRKKCALLPFEAVKKVIE